MRQKSAAVATILQQDYISFFYLVSLGTLYHHTSVNRDMVVDGVTYLGNNSLQSVQPPRLSAVVDREAYQITYLDPTYEFKSLLEDGWVGETMTVSMGFYNTTDGVLSGVSPGQPMLDPADIVIAYKGTIDNQAYTIDADDNVVLTIEGSSPMGSLGYVNSFYTSKDNIKQRLATDTSFDQIYEGSHEVALLWGKVK